MDFQLTEGVEKFRQEVREFIAQEWRPDPSWTPDCDERLEAEKEFRRKLGKKGWLALALPKEYGGQALPIMQQYVFHEEMAYLEAPSFGTAVGIVAPTLIRVGTEEQKKRFLPLITSGEIDFSLGYTEPNAGSDLASLEIRAVADGDDFVINGQKIFTSAAHRAEYCWLAARTDPNVPKHKGVSLFIVDITSPGVTVKPLWTMGGGRTNATYWDSVRVPKENLIGEVNRGWYYVATALDFERLAVFPVGSVRILFDLIVQYVKETTRNGKPLKDDPDVRDKLARLSADLEVAQLFSYRAAWMVSNEIVPNYEASMLKVWGTELLQRVCHFGTQIMGLYGQLQEGSKYAPLNGRLERQHRAAVMPTFGAGSNEIQRNIIATRGLGLPR